MPTYDYACSGCGHRFERFESIRDDAPKACLKCGKKKARRMLGMGAGFIFKGTGFYTTDYKNSSGGSEGGGKPASDKDSAPAEPKKKEEKEPKK